MSYINFPITENELSKISFYAKDYALSNGITMRSPSYPSDVIAHAPICLFPSPLRRNSLDHAKAIQVDINLMIHHLAHDYNFLKNTLQNVIATDEFVANLFKIFETVWNDDQKQPVSLGLFRSDYMEDKNSGTICQIEVNTIASSFGGLASRLGDLHRYTLRHLGVKVDESAYPLNRPVDFLAEGLVEAWRVYNCPGSVIMFLVEDHILNISDQKILEMAILDQDPDVIVIFTTFRNLRSGAQLVNRKLIVEGREVAVVYFRTGYVPDQYEDEDWSMRLLIEQSMAIKCPSIQYQLAGLKKIQQELCKPGVLESFVQDTEMIRSTFVPQYSLELNEEGEKAMQLGIENPDKYVLKPQREGGGFNIYGKQIKEILTSLGKSEKRQSYILLERIVPPPCQNYLLRQGEVPLLADVVSELGVYGIILGSQNSILLNKQGGYLLRSKTAGTEEGGIAAGYGVLDNPLLV